MRFSVKPILLIAATTSLCFYAVAHADELVSLWLKEASNTNKIADFCRTIEFRTNGSVVMIVINKGNNLKDTITSFSGTYAVFYPNTVRLELKSDSTTPFSSIESFIITNDRLEMLPLDTGVVPEPQRYRRVKP